MILLFFSWTIFFLVFVPATGYREICETVGADYDDTGLEGQ